MIELRDVKKIYNMGQITVEALRGVTLSIEKGEFVAIMGPSGSGKSTMMNIIGCLDRPTTGTYHLDGINVAQLSDNQLANLRNKKIGFVFQQFHLLPRNNLLQNVELPLIYAGVGFKERRRRAKEVLKMVGLENRMYHRPNEISGGQKQRAAIARALVNRPSLLLADEPTGNLDSKTGAMIMDLLVQLHQMGNTIVLVTHDPEVAEYAERIIHLRDGLITSDVKK
ncbi:macrolide ABC transporter ATP-binding protein [Anoxybacter fermentans]|uniref:Macrolide ABC transporter ATP-binding protein n=2 Tax=Anoxybacter fermentans TaxID=1323375 RepID=A0A3S9T0Y1_9FIRM|nr:ABC transporter ATP-binding protein [Anoxybacter fermentans]AZR74082.1 macrolide ABC transporter ATP-binding protein [Anoxybacter fermentans]